MALGVGVFLAIRAGRWPLVAALGLLAGACRPVGVLLVAPLAVEALSGWRAVVTHERIERVLAVVAPVVGMALYLLYVGIEFGDPFEPFSIQNRATLRGGFEDPFSRARPRLRRHGRRRPLRVRLPPPLGDRVPRPARGGVPPIAAFVHDLLCV